jgi:hypothetical protein
LNRSASLLASAKTCWKRGVKLFIIAFALPGLPPELVESWAGSLTLTIKGEKNRILR